MIKNVSNILKRDLKLSTKCSYEDAIVALNLLQSNATYLRTQKPLNASRCNTLQVVQKYLLRSGLTLDNLDKLSIIHVAGTKGKGSTCAYCESILREHGFKTGLFVSPHLIEVRERIQINGKPLEKDAFAKHFWTIYNVLDEKKEDSADMPLYFRFLTILAFHVFLKEKVDVAIIEVGIGGEYDCTNIVRKVPVAGITPLGIDHTNVLGDTIEKIAWQKGGIMKKGAKVFTVPQPENAMNVLKERSIEKNCSLEVVPSYETYNWDENFSITETQKTNIALAIKLTNAWLSAASNSNTILEPATNNNKINIPNKTKVGIKRCSWPGRLQIINKDNFKFFLDGAHTVESITNCMNWYAEKTQQSNSEKILFFYVTGCRNFEQLIKIAQQQKFAYVFFLPSIAVKTEKPDNKYNVANKELFKKCEMLKESWLQTDSETKIIKTFESVEDALQYLPKAESFDILVTGSLYLVGAVLELVDPTLEKSNILGA